MEEWKKYKIGELCSISSSKRIFAKEYQSSGVPFFRGKEIIEKQKGESISTELYISRSRYDEIKIKYGVPKEGDMLLTSVGTLGIPYIVKNENFYFKDGNLTWFSDFKGLNSKFLYYWFLSPIAKNAIEAKAIGSTQKALTIDALSKFEINIPDIDTQNRIASVLSFIDDKIELNRRINDNLEQQAQALFNYYFIDTPELLGEFSVGSLADAANYVNGLAMQKYRPINGEKGLPVLKIKELGQGRIDSSSDFCSNEIDSYYKVYDGDVIFSWSGTLMVKIWCGGKCGLNQHLFKVSSKTTPKWFYYFWTKHHLDNFIRIAKDKAVTMGHIKRGELEKAEVLFPNNSVMKKLDTLMAPFLDQIIEKECEIRKLALLRDTLLPKLISGELVINDINN